MGKLDSRSITLLRKQVVSGDLNSHQLFLPKFYDRNPIDFAIDLQEGGVNELWYFTQITEKQGLNTNRRIVWGFGYWLSEAGSKDVKSSNGRLVGFYTDFIFSPIMPFTGMEGIHRIRVREYRTYSPTGPEGYCRIKFIDPSFHLSIPTIDQIFDMHTALSFPIESLDVLAFRSIWDLPASYTGVFKEDAERCDIPTPRGNMLAEVDTGCPPMRSTLNKIPFKVDLLQTSAMPLALLVQPLAPPHPSKEPIQDVDFGKSGPVRCSRCKGYINPKMKFIDEGRRFICNLCGFHDETPRDYHCNLGPDGRRRDADERPELCRGTFEFAATEEYVVQPRPAVFFFLIDVSMNAIQTGATAAACDAIKKVIADLPKGPRTMVGIATVGSTFRVHNLKQASQQPLMRTEPDVQDNTPLIQLSECRERLEILLKEIPTRFEITADSAFGEAVKAAFLAMKSTGGKLLVFQSVLPSIGIGSRSAREAEGRSNVAAGEEEADKLLQPLDEFLKTMAVEFAKYQVCVDLFITTKTYVDIASLSVIPRTTGGQVYYYYPFSPLSDSAKLYNDLRRNVTRPQGFEAVMRVRCSKGIQVQDCSGNFCIPTNADLPTDIDLPAIDCDKTIMVTLKHDGELQEDSVYFQCTLIYTNVDGDRKIRVSNLSVPCTRSLADLFDSADLDTLFACIVKQTASEIRGTSDEFLRAKVTDVCTDILYAYDTVSPYANPLRLPENLRMLPLYAFAFLKNTAFRSDGSSGVDSRSFWINYVSPLPARLVIPFVYPRMIAIHDLGDEELDDSIVPTSIPLSSYYISDDGVYLLENGQDCLIYVGKSVQRSVLQQLFGISSVDEISDEVLSHLSKKLNNVLNEIRRQRCSYLRLKLCKTGDPSAEMFFSYLVEDGGYYVFMFRINRLIQQIWSGVEDDVFFF